MSEVLDRVLVVRESATGSSNSARRRVLTAIAAMVFVVGSAIAVTRLEMEPSQIQWPLILLAGGLGVPLTALINAWEYSTSAHILGHRPGIIESLRVSITGTAANLLPIPGATLVRVRELRTLGSGYRSAGWITLSVGLIWIGTSAGLVGALQLGTGSLTFGTAILLGGAGTLAMALVTIGRAGVPASGRLPAFTRILVVEGVLVGVNIFRQWLVLLAIGADAPLAGATVLVLSAALAAAAGVFPGGLGLRELLSAVMSPLVGVGAAAGFVAAAVNRLLGTVGHGLLAVPFGLWKRPTERSLGSRQSNGAGTSDF